MDQTAQMPKSSAKVAAPTCRQLVPRPHLYDRLHDFRETTQAVWISAPAGSGKTSLIASYLQNIESPSLWYRFDSADEDVGTFFHYLSIAARSAGALSSLPTFTAEHQGSLSAFARAHFRRLLQLLPPDCALVFDDHQELSEDSPLQHLLQVLISENAGQRALFFLSRALPPAALSRQQLYGSLGLLGRSDLHFSPQETRLLFAELGQSDCSDRLIEKAHSLTQGWAAGLTLLAENTRFSVDLLESFDAADTGLLFHYFAEELFRHLEPGTRQVLLRTSFLDPLNLISAGDLTGCDCEAIFRDLHRCNHFVTRVAGDTSCYQIHPLYREFLQHTARQSLTAEELHALIRETARHLERNGAPERAGKLLVEIADWPGLGELVLAHAQALIAQGRNETVLGWLLRLPETERQKSPWLDYWGGQCALSVHPHQARAFFVAAFEGFEAAGDTASALLAWSGLVDSFVFAWDGLEEVDPWLARFDELMAASPDLSPEVEARVVLGIFKILAWRSPDRPDLFRWKERLKALVLQSDNPPFRLIAGGDLLHYESFLGDFRTAAILWEKLRAEAEDRSLPPILRLYWFCMQSIYEFLAGEHQACLATVETAAALQEESGLFLFDLRINAQGLASAACHGDRAAASAYRERVGAAATSADLEKALQDYLIGLYHLHRGEYPAAMAAADLAWQRAETSGCPFICALICLAQAQCEFGLGNHERATDWLERGEGYATGIESALCQMELMRSAFALERGDLTEADAALAIAVRRAARHGYGNLPIWDSGLMAKLCARALQNGVEIDFVRTLIRKRGLLPPTESNLPDNWPWPVRIHTLGEFRVEIDGNTSPPSRKPEKRPWDLLKILVVAGPGGMSTDQAVENIAPEKNRKTAYNIYSLALHRLRLRLGAADAVLTRSGRVALNPDLCWVDVWNFVNLTKGVHDNAPRPADSRRQAAQLDRALTLYQGPFDAEGSDHPDLHAYIEQISRRFIRVIKSRADLSEQDGDWEQAIAIFELGLQRVPAHEPFYRNLMFCYGKIGYLDGVRETFRTCQTRLDLLVGVSPSAETRRLYSSLISS